MRNTNGDQLKEIFLFNITQRYKKKKKSCVPMVSVF